MAPVDPDDEAERMRAAWTPEAIEWAMRAGDDLERLAARAREEEREPERGEPSGTFPEDEDVPAALNALRDEIAALGASYSEVHDTSVGEQVADQLDRFLEAAGFEPIESRDEFQF